MYQRASRSRVLAGVACCLAVFAVLSCASLRPADVRQESGFFYGIGQGASASEAAEAARQDLISNALSETARRLGSRERIDVGIEAARAFELPKLKPIAQDKTVDSVTVVYRLKATEWDKRERVREEAIRAEIMQNLAALKTASALPLAERLARAGSMIERLRHEGLADLLTEASGSSSLVVPTIEEFCRQTAAGIRVQVDPEGGFIERDPSIEVSILTPGGEPAGAVPLNVEWSAKAGEPSSSTVTTSADGRAVLAYPAGPGFRNRSVRLRISTAFARSAPGSAELRSVDLSSEAQFRYCHFDDIAGFFGAEAFVPGGPFTAGALPGDKRASRKEAPRQGQASAFFIDVYPVTNALYEMFLEDSKSETFPEYWDNPAYNQPDQPVIGVCLEEANRFASWLSARLGVAKRLPTEDEWEKAARGGRDVIYPWGDESPTAGLRANYSGNGRFTATSPVGSFESGRNAYGLYDMAGNVWEWTSTQLDAGNDAGTAKTIVKGGSWMDGPADLRVSNRREADPSRGYADIGFRLVREALHE
jgi:hypothetical protein